MPHTELPSIFSRHWAESALSIFAVIIAAISLWIAIDTESTNRQLVAEAAWPFVQTYTSSGSNSQQPLTLSVGNAGVGPAKIETLELFWNGKPYRTSMDMHVQQFSALDNDEHPTLLERALIEGGAEFGTELILSHPAEVTSPPLRAATLGHEKEIETAFVADEDNKDLSEWLDNSTLERPGDLGYWVGYRIVKSYYQHAADKRRALRDIIEITVPKAFLAKSGWYPGIVLQ